MRTHDAFYAMENPNSRPKDSFIQCADLIEEFLKDKKESNKETNKIADFGCATGHFVNYMSSRFENEEVVGYELLNSLISRARVFFPSVNIRQGSIFDQSVISCQTYDVITVMGVLSIFDEVDEAIRNLIYWTKPGGKLFIHGMFNPYDLDVWIKYEESGAKGNLESGWNIISQKTMTSLLLQNGATAVSYHKFNISVDLSPNPMDPVRSWTERLESGDRQIVNGLFLKQPQYICEVSV